MANRRLSSILQRFTMPRLIDQFGRKRYQKKLEDIGSKLLNTFFKKKIAVHELWALRFWLTVYIWPQFAWNGSVIRTKLSPCMLSIDSFLLSKLTWWCERRGGGAIVSHRLKRRSSISFWCQYQSLKIKENIVKLMYVSNESKLLTILSWKGIKDIFYGRMNCLAQCMHKENCSSWAFLSKTINLVTRWRWARTLIMMA